MILHFKYLSYSKLIFLRSDSYFMPIFWIIPFTSCVWCYFM